ncbi:bacterioferritin comigratory protein [Vibrio cyclitrophicus]|uniref:bacterioferritin comigratory protein n=1 Tax=Vibrio cyclitrophicus TaxID=47951 RepID=UPI000C854D65|nr:bacterioferritin comigratory protein [Vibrio cyclitrophicus]PMI45026.1 bacterioferritin comigratory protein [Vibrio cyclitrophicus]
MKLATKKALEDALERLIKGEPTNLGLKKKAKQGKLKVNNNTVEKEAGLSVGVLRNHSDIKEMIKARSLSEQVVNSDSANSEIELLQQENKKLKSEKTHLNKLKSKHLLNSRKNEEALAVQAATHIKIIQELMEMLPASEREKAMDKVVNTRPNNIVEGNFRK